MEVRIMFTETQDCYLQTYRTGTGRLEIDFLFCNLRGNRGWRIYIVSRIFYGRKDSGSHAAHWLQDTYEGYRYICWNAIIPDLDSAKTIAAIWAECTDRYIHEPENFDTIANRIMRQVSWRDV